MPFESEAQRRAFWAAAAGHGQIGIPEGVAKRMTSEDPGGKLPAKAKDMSRSGWRRIFEGLAEMARFFGEEEREPEHGDEQKQPKSSVSYTDEASNSAERCGLCQHFEAPDGCAKVEGTINPDGWCELFEKSEAHDAQRHSRGQLFDESPRAASVAFTTADGKVLLVRRGKDEKNYAGHWAFPGGGAEEGEDHVEAAKRECLEEIGDCGFDGMKELRRVRTPRGLDHVTFVVPVGEEFEPTLNREHDAYAWVPVTQMPERTHPGVRAVVDEVLMGYPVRTAMGRQPEGWDDWSPEARAAAAKARKAHLHMTATPATGGKPAFKTQAGSHAEIETHLSNLHKHVQANKLPTHHVSIENKHTGEVHNASVSHHGVHGRSFASGSFDDLAKYRGPMAHDEMPWPVGWPIEMAADRASVRSVDSSGHMHVTDTVLSKAVVSPYLGSEINGVMKDHPGWVMLEPDRKYMLLRDPEELKKGAKSFNGQPLLWRHQASTADDHPADIVIGSTGTNATFDGENLRNDLSIWPAYATKVVEDGTKKSLSCGYGYVADMTPGIYKGRQYDGVMRNIEGNHVALVDQPRVPGASVGGDSADDLFWVDLAEAIRSLAA